MKLKELKSFLAELKELPVSELNTKLNQLKETLMRLRFDQKTGKLTATHKIRETKKNIARIKTILNQKIKKTINKDKLLN